MQIPWLHLRTAEPLNLHFLHGAHSKRETARLDASEAGGVTGPISSS